MTQGIERMLGLPPLEDALREHGLLDEDAVPDFEVSAEVPQLQGFTEMADQAGRQLAAMGGVDHSEAMDGVYKEALKHARSMMDLGFNIDPSRMRGIFEVATVMYARALEAKNAKRDAELKAMKLMLDSRKLDLEERKFRAVMGEGMIEAEATVITEDRNELLRRIREQNKADAAAKKP